MCDKEIPILFYNTFGGSLQKRRRTLSMKHKMSYEWILSSKNSIEFLEIIIPYLRVNRKIETANIYLEFQKHVSDLNIKYKQLGKEELNYREIFYLKCKELNHRGELYDAV